MATLNTTFADDARLDTLFAREGATGTLLVSSLDEKREFVHDSARAEQRFPIASTFKIFNTLIALDTGVIASADDVIHWDGTIYKDFPDWNRDHTLASAYKVSCVWCYQQLARKIGVDTYTQRLREASYGHLDTPIVVDQFWLDGSLTISAREQVRFLRALVNKRLHAKATSYETLRTVMLMDDNADYRLYAKTGWAARSTPRIGWYVGYVETRHETWLFALNMNIQDNTALPERQRLTLAGLRELGIIRPPRSP